MLIVSRECRQVPVYSAYIVVTKNVTTGAQVAPSTTDLLLFTGWNRDICTTNWRSELLMCIQLSHVFRVSMWYFNIYFLHILLFLVRVWAVYFHRNIHWHWKGKYPIRCFWDNPPIPHRKLSRLLMLRKYCSFGTFDMTLMHVFTIAFSVLVGSLMLFSYK